MSTQEPIDIGFVSRKKVLVAEDEASIASLIDDWLSDFYEVLVASNGTAALQKAKWNSPDVILMDVVMPDMGGYEVIRALRSDPSTSQIPVIAMSAQNFDDSTIKLIKGEVNVMGFINKPFKPDALKSTIEQVLSGQRALEPSPADTTAPAAQPAPAAPPPKPAAPARSRVPPPPPRRDPPPRPARRRGDGPDGPSWFLGFIAFCVKLCLKTAFLVLALFFTGEAACRLTTAAFGRAWPAPPVRPTRGTAAPPFEFIPGAAWEHEGTNYRFNSWGLRDGELPLVKAAGVYRVYLLGGSTAFGEGVRLDDTAAKSLERLLNENPPFPAYARYEVINGGLWGFSLRDQWASFERIAPSLNPDAVLWVMEPDPAGALAIRAPEGVPPAAALWLRRSRLLWLSMDRLRPRAAEADDALDRARDSASRLNVAFAAARLAGEAGLGNEGEELLDPGSWRIAGTTGLPPAGQRWMAERLLEMLKRTAGEGNPAQR